uniref:Enhancer of yellow 2 transcription factor n=1 Tax=Anopheles atroparvus TaxID=41427 RepID=A0AAG5DSZ3_ANOAO
MYSKSTDQITLLHGDRVRLKHLLRTRLVECGWTEQVKLLGRKAIIDGGETNVDNIIQKITPEARGLIPDLVKKELLEKIRLILQEQQRRDILKRKDELKKKDEHRKKEDFMKKDTK